MYDGGMLMLRIPSQSSGFHTRNSSCQNCTVHSKTCKNFYVISNSQIKCIENLKQRNTKFVLVLTSAQKKTHNYCTLCLKKRVNFETVQLKIITVDFDEIWKKYSKYSRIEFACFSFCVGVLFFINFLSFKPDTKNNANFDAVSSKCANFDEYSFFYKTYT